MLISFLAVAVISRSKSWSDPAWVGSQMGPPGFEPGTNGL